MISLSFFEIIDSDAMASVARVLFIMCSTGLMCEIRGSTIVASGYSSWL